MAEGGTFKDKKTKRDMKKEYVSPRIGVMDMNVRMVNICNSITGTSGLGDDITGSSDKPTSFSKFGNIWVDDEEY